MKRITSDLVYNCSHRGAAQRLETIREVVAVLLREAKVDKVPTFGGENLLFPESDDLERRVAASVEASLRWYFPEREFSFTWVPEPLSDTENPFGFLGRFVLEERG